MRHALSIRHTISCRRLLYLKRQDSELTKRILKAQANNPSPGDFINLISDDLNIVDEKIEFKVIEIMSTCAFKTWVKKNIMKAAFKHLKTLQEKHYKIKEIQNKEFKTQSYMLAHFSPTKKLICCTP